jgi:hypothetical protein
MTRRGNSLRATVLALCGLATALVALPAYAWRQYHTKDAAVTCSQDPEACGCGLRWYAKDIDFVIDDGGLIGVSQPEAQLAIDAAFGAWEAVQCTLCGSSDGPGCPPSACAANPLGIHLHDKGFAPPTPVGATCNKLDAKGETCVDVASNGNFVMFIKDKAQWQEATNQSQFVFALTILTYNRQTGAIADADILLDDADFDFCTTGCKPTENSLCNTLTHEAGHFLGLDHTTEPDATMYATAPSGETRKCTLHDDDRLGICTAYRTACSSQGCPENMKSHGFLGLCSASRTGRAEGTLVLVFLAMAGVVALRGRQRRRDNSLPPG